MSFATLEDAITANKSLGDRYVVVLSLAGFKYFSLLLSHRHIVEVPKEMCLLEMVLSNTARPFIDFDSDIEAMIPEIETMISEYFFGKHKLHVTMCWRYSDSTHPIVATDKDTWNNATTGNTTLNTTTHRRAYDHGRHWHCVISGIYYEGCWAEECEDMVHYILGKCHSNNTMNSSMLPDDATHDAICPTVHSGIDVGDTLCNDARRCVISIDRGIYRQSVSSLRMIGQCKYDNGNYTRRLIPLKPYDVEDLCVSYAATDICLYTSTAQRSNNVTHSGNGMKGYSLLGSSLMEKIPYGLTLGKVIHSDEHRLIFRLDRVKSSHCSICDRAHDRENGMLLLRQGSMEVKCFRNMFKV